MHAETIKKYQLADVRKILYPVRRCPHLIKLNSPFCGRPLWTAPKIEQHGWQSYFN